MGIGQSAFSKLLEQCKAEKLEKGLNQNKRKVTASVKEGIYVRFWILQHGLYEGMKRIFLISILIWLLSIPIFQRVEDGILRKKNKPDRSQRIYEKQKDGKFGSAIFKELEGYRNIRSFFFFRM